MTTKPGFDAYFRFLNLATVVQGLPCAPKCDFAEERLLQALAAAWYSGRALTVTEAMALSVAGAPATVRRKLESLKNQGLIAVQSSEDLRVKFMIPTPKALDYFSRLGACLEDVKQKR